MYAFEGTELHLSVYGMQGTHSTIYIVTYLCVEE